MGFEQAQIGAYQRSIVDVLAETAHCAGSFYDLHNNGLTGPFLDHDGTWRSPEDFQALVGNTLQRATEALHIIGGLPLRYTDSVSQASTSVWGFCIEQYGVASDTWTITSTSTGQPPVHNQLITEVKITTPKLRQAYADALAPIADSIHSRPLHPREP